MEAVDKFVDQLLTDKGIEGMDDEVRAELKRDLAERLTDEIDRAVIGALPEDKAVELSEKLDDENFTNEDAAEFLQESGVDMQRVSLETMLRFRDLYLGVGE
jgi:FKBP-type peptidyl-prolyl cis-trans isomerase (trigger factor)